MAKHITVCAYSRCTAAEVVALVQWAERELSEKCYRLAPAGNALYETARTLLWHEDDED